MADLVPYIVVAALVYAAFNVAFGKSARNEIRRREDYFDKRKKGGSV